MTGRTQRAGESPWDGTIGDTAAAITAAGGKGVAVRVDHRNGISDREGRHPPSVRELMSVRPVNYQGEKER